MSVNRRKWRDPKTGKQKSCFEIYIDRRKLDGVEKPVRKKAKIQTRRGAEQEEREIREAIACGTYDQKEVEEKQRITFREFADEFIETYASVNNKPSEVLSKKGILNRYLLSCFGTNCLDEIKLRDVERFKARLLKRNLSPKTVNNALAVLGKMLRYAVDIELLETIPRINLLRVPKPQFDFLSFEEAEQLLIAAEHNSEWLEMIRFALRTGLRYGELCELRWFDIDLKNGRVNVRRSYYLGHVTTPKGGREREIPLSPLMVEHLKKHRHIRGELVFCKEDGDRRLYDGANEFLKTVCRLANLRPITWHVLRHTFASHLVMKGAALKTVQELLGHATMDMTMRYAHLSPEVKRDAVVLLDSFTPLPNNSRTREKNDENTGAKK